MFSSFHKLWGLNHTSYTSMQSLDIQYRYLPRFYTGNSNTILTWRKKIAGRQFNNWLQSKVDQYLNISKNRLSKYPHWLQDFVAPICQTIQIAGKWAKMPKHVGYGRRHLYGNCQFRYNCEALIDSPPQGGIISGKYGTNVNAAIINCNQSSIEGPTPIIDDDLAADSHH